ncbi:hypothetical protein [Fodinicola feengrottensis]|uniref:hypothetical protein n=1 Tax=Fodinicola feengrottensis TaxID=435914 RepID=UPI0024430D67|nr:hypothetical protein [Fodinicola feengrottensis]
MLRDETDHVRTARVGRRRKALYVAALNLGRLVAGGVLPANVARSVLEGCARSTSRLARTRSAGPMARSQTASKPALNGPAPLPHDRRATERS